LVWTFQGTCCRSTPLRQFAGEQSLRPAPGALLFLAHRRRSEQRFEASSGGPPPILLAGGKSLIAPTLQRIGRDPHLPGHHVHIRTFRWQQSRSRPVLESLSVSSHVLVLRPRVAILSGRQLV